ncbi:MAG: hypothetical protein KAV68_01735 [Dehalococcoidales bacterium]|nr:hypothetical protein [Dehalococcoidales bacterium]
MAISDWLSANLITIIFVLSILVLIYFIIEVVRTIRRKRSDTSPITAILLILGLAVAVFLIFRAQDLESADLAQVILTIGLIAVTAVYASFTEKQARASAEIAEETREQTVVASRPIIIQKALYEKDVWVGNNQDYFAHFEISSVGNTPAIEVVSSIVDNEDNSLHSIRQTYLKKDDPPIKFRPYNIANLEKNKTYYLVCDYQSIFSYGTQKPLYQTRLPFKISKAAKEDKIYVIAGELEFPEIQEKDRIDAFGNVKPK